jgi:transcriptional regulator with GAF, ATPase, and Fis domain
VPQPFNVRLLDLLAAMARELVTELGADACGISRAIGDVLIMVTDYATSGETLQLGAGYLVPDYPLTQRVLATREPLALTLGDGRVDEAEASVLVELGYGALLMLPLDLSGEPWGLVEVYRAESRPFAENELRRAQAIIARASAPAD